MSRRRRLRRRLLWAGVLLGLVVLLATVSVLRVGLWARQRTQGLATFSWGLLAARLWELGTDHEKAFR